MTSDGKELEGVHTLFVSPQMLFAISTKNGLNGYAKPWYLRERKGGGGGKKRRGEGGRKKLEKNDGCEGEEVPK